MKKNLLLIIFLLISGLVSAQEVNRSLNLKSLRQGSGAQLVPFNRTYSSVHKSMNEGTEAKKDSAITFDFTSQGDSVLVYDSVLAYKEINRYNSEGYWYFQSYRNFYDKMDYRWHINWDDMGNFTYQIRKDFAIPLSTNQYNWGWIDEATYDSTGNRILYENYFWDAENYKWHISQSLEMIYDSKGKKTQKINKQWNTNIIDWEITKWEMFYQEEATYPTMSSVEHWWEWEKADDGYYSWYYLEKTYKNLWYTADEGEYDTLSVISTWNNTDSVWVNSIKERREFDENGYMIFVETFEWVNNKWVPIVKNELLHGPDGHDTISRGYRWNNDSMAWNPDWVDTIIWYENGGWKEIKFGYWNSEKNEWEVLERITREYDETKNKMTLKEYGWGRPVTDQDWEDIAIFDINYNEIFTETKYFDTNEVYTGGAKRYSYYSLPEVSTDASLYDVTFKDIWLHPVVNDSYIKNNMIFNDKLNEYVILNDGSNVIPPVTYVKNDPNSTVVVTEAKDSTSAIREDRTTTITVTAEDGTTTQKYYFDFYKPNGIATLDTIIVSKGKLYPDFKSDVFYYYDTIYGCCENGVPAPEIGYMKTEPYEKVVINDATNICNKNYNKTVITVTSDNDFKTEYYRITFTVLEDTIPPVAICKDSTIYLDPTEYVLLDASDIDGGSIVCGLPLLELDKDSFTIADAGVNTITLTVTDSKGKTDECTSNLTIIITGVNAINSSDFIIYPNPVSELINVEHSSPIKEVIIYNILGVEVKRYEMNFVNTVTIHLAGLNKGFYFIRILDEQGKTFIQKIVKD